MIIAILMFLGLHTPIYQPNDCLLRDMRYTFEKEEDAKREFEDTPSTLKIEDASIYRVIKTGKKNYQVLLVAYKGYLFRDRPTEEKEISEVDSNKDYSKIDCKVLEPKESE